MNLALWVLQILSAIVYAASGVMKLFMFDEISKDVRSFDALPRKAWAALGALELACTAGQIVPSALRWHPRLSVVAAALLALESLVFIWVHGKRGETSPLVMSAALGLVMAFIAYGRLSLQPIL